MSCIAYICKCVLVKGRRCTDVDCDREHYMKIQDFESCVFYCGQEVPEISDDFFGVINDLITAFDRERYFCSCSKCTLEIRKNYSLKKEFADGRHADCFHEIDTYFSEIVSKEIREGCLFQVCNLCRKCIVV